MYNLGDVVLCGGLDHHLDLWSEEGVISSRAISELRIIGAVNIAIFRELGTQLTGDCSACQLVAGEVTESVEAWLRGSKSEGLQKKC